MTGTERAFQADGIRAMIEEVEPLAADLRVHGYGDASAHVDAALRELRAALAALPKQ